MKNQPTRVRKALAMAAAVVMMLEKALIMRKVP
jgi:hypothetical protein